MLKKIFKKSLVKVPFESNKKRFEENNLISIGPGRYYKETSFVKKILSKSPPFNISDKKEFEKNNYEETNLGPGRYNLDSYFKWNKKSYNMLY